MTKLPPLPVEFGEHTPGLRRQPPAVGEHTGEILAELGLENSEIETLCKRGIVAAHAGAELKAKRNQ
jgi:crotonobetainyl-CoA:carnitine CoA-transferase CaiB-like acyl-CoA transferase